MKQFYLILSLLCLTAAARSQTNTTMLLNKYTSRPTEDILIDLNALKIRELDGENIEQPLITLLAGGNRIPVRGFLVDMKNEPKENGVVMKLQDSNDVLFVEIYAIAGIVIHEADRIAPLLVDLAPADAASFPAVTRLEIKKRIAEESARLTAAFGQTAILLDEDIPAKPEELFFTKLFLTDVTMALITIGKTEEGKNAIREEVKEIHVRRGAELAVSRDSGKLIIQFPFTKSYTTNKERHALVDKVYNVL
ncbi:MAG: hypothetical protein JSS79_01095 [Bacteroidetes bacterium]|nr:hypothetical protein [Bacteroidota bacterium]